MRSKSVHSIVQDRCNKSLPTASRKSAATANDEPDSNGAQFSRVRLLAFCSIYATFQGMNTSPRAVRNYATTSGQKPFEEWLQSLRDVKTRALIRARINRLRLGNFGDSGAVGGGVYELRIHTGPGYRIYFAEESTIVVLLCGGSKRTQQRDTERAKEYWQELRRRSHE